MLTIHTVLTDIFMRQPPLRGEVRGIVCIQEAVIARVRQEGLQCEKENRPDGGEEGQQDEDHAHDVLPGFSEIDLTELSGFTGDGRVVCATGDGGLVETQDQDTEEHHDDREDAGFTSVLRVQRDVLRRQGREAEVMRNRVGAHRGSEDEQDRTEDRRPDHRQRHAQHDLPLRGIEDGRRFLEVRIHVLKDAADQDIGERCVVETEHHGTRESAEAEPLRHTDAEQRCEEAI